MSEDCATRTYTPEALDLIHKKFSFELNIDQYVVSITTVLWLITIIHSCTGAKLPFIILLSTLFLVYQGLKIWSDVL